jgi:ferric-dicitrate binding protein FerR (iron transport regulator)
MTPRDRLQYERTARIWTEAERAAASDKIARHFERMNAERQRGRGAWVLAAIMFALLALIATTAPAKIAATVVEAEARAKAGY